MLLDWLFHIVLLVIAISSPIWIALVVAALFKGK